MTMCMRAFTRWSVLCLTGIASSVGAQTLASRVAAAGNGQVNFHFTSRRGVCGDGDRFVRTGHSYQGNWWGHERSAPCTPGPVQVRLTVREGEVERVESWAGTLRQRDGHELGAFSAVESAQYLLGIARRNRTSASAKAIFPAVLADSAVVWPTLLVIARDSGAVRHGTRQEAVFWLSRFAAAHGANGGGGGGELFDDTEDDDNRDGGEESVKTHAVFVLSQLPHHDGVPALLEIGRTNADRKVRGQALFWLGQSGDPRAIALFEQLLRGS